MPEQNTAVAKRSPLDLAIAETSAAFDAAMADTSASLGTTLAMGDALQALRAQFTPEVMRKIRALSTSALGFKTDRAYPDDALRDFAIEAAIRGVPLVNQMATMISGKCYVGRAGFEYLLARLPQVANLETQVLYRKTEGGHAVFDIAASWKQDGDKRSYATEIRIRQDSGSSLDNLGGKAMRRLLARVYQMATGKYVRDADPEQDADAPAGLEVATPKFLEAPAAPLSGSPERTYAAEPVMIAPAHQQPEPPPAPAPQPPPEPAPAPAPAPAKRGPGRPPGSKTTPKPTPPPVQVAAAPEPEPELLPPSKATPAVAAPRQPDLSSLGAMRVERPQALTLPQFRQVMADVGVEESELLAHLSKKHGLGPDVTSLEQLALVRQPLWNWCATQAQTALEQVLFALGRS